eukprot:jgi/Tetstr1/448456/TSEL_035724.t1
MSIVSATQAEIAAVLLRKGKNATEEIMRLAREHRGAPVLEEALKQGWIPARRRPESESFDQPRNTRFTADVVLAMHTAGVLEKFAQEKPFAVATGLIECDIPVNRKVELLNAVFARARDLNTCAVDPMAPDPKIATAVIQHVLAAGRADIIESCEQYMQQTRDFVVARSILEGERSAGFAEALPGMLKTIVAILSEK